MATKTARRIVHQRAKGPIDPSFGVRLRELRTGKGLTQQELAGNDFTKGFISLVETGRTRVSLRAAEILAGRLGIAVADLLNPAPSHTDPRVEFELVRAETELTAGRPQEALDIAEKLAPRTTGAGRARLERLRGRALLARGEARQALSHLDEAFRSYQSSQQRDLAARVAFDLAQAHAQLAARGEALSYAARAEQALLDAAIVDRTFEFQVLSFLAGEFVLVGDLAAADMRLERARRIAEDVSDPRALANLYENLAHTRQRQGDYEGALAYAQRSLRAYEELGNRKAIGSTWNTIGWVYLQRRQFARAEDALDRAAAISADVDDPALIAYVLQNRAELALARGNADQAERLARESMLHPHASARCRALSALVRARALARAKRPLREVTRAFEEAIDGLRAHGTGTLSRAYQAYFEALVDRGEAKQANAAAQKALELLQPVP